VIPYTAVQIGQIGVKVVVYLKFASWFSKKDPTASTENLNVSVTTVVQALNDFISQRSFSTDPAHKAVHLSPFRSFE
jgi:hypothetical protein